MRRLYIRCQSCSNHGANRQGSRRSTLIADFEAKTGTHVTITYGTGVSTRKTVASGGALDVSLLFAPFPEALATGNIDRRSATVIARLRLAVAVKKGAPKPSKIFPVR